MMMVWHGRLRQISGLNNWLPFDPGAMAVDIFFVISGFIVAYSTASTPSRPGRFFTLRVIRIVPLYWAATLVLAALEQMAPSQLASPFSWGLLAHSLAFVPPYPLFKLGWTLNYQMFFYALFALSLWLSQKWRLPVLGVTLCTLVAIGLKFGPLAGAPLVYTDVRMLAFLAGMLIAWMTEPAPYLAEFVGFSSSTGKATFALKMRGDGMGDPSGRPSFPAGSAILVEDPIESTTPGWMGLGAAWIIGGMVCLTFVHSPWLLIVGSALVVTGSLSLRVFELKSRLLLELGNSSYSIYLTHLFTLGALCAIWNHLIPRATTASAIVLMFISLVASAGVGWVCYRFVEKPLRAWMRGVVVGTEKKAEAAGPAAPPIAKPKLLY
jgi:exopolysaccharide production protein ExoZ